MSSSLVARWTLLLATVLLNQARSQWVAVPVDYSGLIPRVFFVDSRIGWVVGGNFGVEFIAKTIDGGNLWHQQATGRQGTLRDGYFVDSLRGWAVGDSLRIVRTTDGGATWTDQRFSNVAYESFNSLSFVDSLLGWAAGSGSNDPITGDYRPVVFRTTDGGTTWQEQNCPANGWITSIRFVSSDSGWAVGWTKSTDIYGLVARTIDGGSTWLIDSTDISDWLFSVDFVDSRNGWTVGRPGIILHTTDGGESWAQQASGSDQPLTCVDFVSRDSGWVGGSWGTMLATTNGGLVWSRQVVPIASHITSVQFLSSSEGWGSSDASPLIHTVNGGATFILPQLADAMPNRFVLGQNYPNPFNPTTMIQYQLPVTAYAKLVVYDLLGRELEMLVNEQQAPGSHDVKFNAAWLASGVYLYRLTAGDFAQTRTMLLLK